MIERILEEAQKKADEAEVYFLNTVDTDIGFEAGKLKRISSKETSGAAVRMIAQGRLGFGTTSNLAETKTLVDKTYELSKLSEKTVFSFAEESHDLVNLDLTNRETEDFSLEKMIEIGSEAIASIKAYDPAIKISVGIGKSTEIVHVINSKKLNRRYQKNKLGIGVSGTLVEGDNILQVSEHYSGLKPPAEYGNLASKCIDLLNLGRKNVPIKAGKYKVILTPGALADVLIPFLAGINGHAASKGITPLLNKEGKKILDERVSIIDDGTIPEGILSAPFDDEGITVKKKYIVNKGIFQTFLTDLKSAAQLKSTSTGNGVRETFLERSKSFETTVSSGTFNIIMEPGNMPLDDLRKDICTGIEIERLTGVLLGNVINGDFSGNIDLGFKLEKGVRTGRVKNAMFSGNFYNIFTNNLIGIESQNHHTGYLGGGMGSFFLPHVLLDDIFIAAK